MFRGLLCEVDTESERARPTRVTSGSKVGLDS